MVRVAEPKLINMVTHLGGVHPAAAEDSVEELAVHELDAQYTNW